MPQFGASLTIATDDKARFRVRLRLWLTYSTDVSHDDCHMMIIKMRFEMATGFFCFQFNSNSLTYFCFCFCESSFHSHSNYPALQSISCE